MTTPLTRIDPALPVCWEDQQTLRIGFDRAEARIAAPSAKAQRIIGALLEGVHRDRVSTMLRELGSSPAEWASLTEQLAPALVSEPERNHVSDSLRIGVIGSGTAADELMHALGRAGYSAGRFTPQQRGWQLVVVIERFIELPVIADYRLASGLPQLLIRFSDRSFSVGPLVEGGGAPCLGCVTLHDVDADPALPSIAAQLVGKLPAAENHAAAEAAAALAVTLVRHWRSGSPEPGGARWRVPVLNGLPSPAAERQRVSSHPECGCRLSSASTGRPPQ